VEGFQWDEHNEAHVLEHGVDPEEAVDALLDPGRIRGKAYNQGEQRWAALGETEEGRLLFTVFTRRDGLVRVITARDATSREKRSYRKQN